MVPGPQHISAVGAVRIRRIAEPEGAFSVEEHLPGAREAVDVLVGAVHVERRSAAQNKLPAFPDDVVRGGLRPQRGSVRDGGDAGEGIAAVGKGDHLVNVSGRVNGQMAGSGKVRGEVRRRAGGVFIVQHQGFAVPDVHLRQDVPHIQAVPLRAQADAVVVMPRRDDFVAMPQGNRLFGGVHRHHGAGIAVHHFQGSGAPLRLSRGGLHQLDGSQLPAVRVKGHGGVFMSQQVGRRVHRRVNAGQQARIHLYRSARHRQRAVGGHQGNVVRG